MMSDSSKGSSKYSSVKRSSTEPIGGVVKKKINLSAGARFGFKKTEKKSSEEKTQPAPITLKLGKKEDKTAQKNTKLLPKSKKAAAIFNDDSDSEPEEMPAEARMRMRNVGRDTPTSAGPNSFNKGKLGFCDTQKLWELKQKDLTEKNKKQMD